MPLSPLRAALAGLLLLSLAPSSALGSTWTVDDDGAQCPNAPFTSIQAAVDQAAPYDTVVVCDGTYLERHGELPGGSPTQAPTQQGSKVALFINKPLTIRGTGAQKVSIRPAPSLGSTLAGVDPATGSPKPYLRDLGGAVVQISRQSLGASDDNENFVSISGVTIEAPSTYAEALVSFFNASGRIARSKVGPLLRLGTPNPNTDAQAATNLGVRPHGYGVLSVNTLQGQGTGTVRRQVTVEDSLVTGYQSGGIRFDNARGVDGDALNTQRSGIISYGFVDGTRVEGQGPGTSPNLTSFPQTGVQFHAGFRGAVTDSQITGNDFRTTSSGAQPRRSVGLLLTDAETGADPANPVERAFEVSGTSFTDNGYALFNANAANDAVRQGAPAKADVGNWFGCPAGPNVGSPSDPAAGGCEGVSGSDATPAASVELAATPLASAPPAPSVPAPTTDALPTASLDVEPQVTAGRTIEPTVLAGDDFGVRSVQLTVDGVALPAKATRPYEFALVAKAEDAGRTIPVTAVVTDSSGQSTTRSASFTVVAAPAAPAPAPAPGPAPRVLAPPTSLALPEVVGDVSVGNRLSCLPGTWSNRPERFDYVWLRSGTPVGAATAQTYRVTLDDLDRRLSCRVTATNADGTATATSPARGAAFLRTTRLASGATRVQLGRSALRLVASARPAARRLALGTATCPRTAATSCRFTIAATLAAGDRRFALRAATTVPRGRSGALRVTLTPAAAAALRAARRGTLTARIALRGTRRTVRVALAVRP